jgi:long-chain acyl-CoA synthetase
MEKTINQAFKNRVQQLQDRLAVEKKIYGRWETATWNQYYERSRSVGLGLYELGVRHGDRVAILSENRLEWVYTDMGGLGIGACIVPIYATVPPKDVEYVINNSESKVVVVENQEQLSKVLEIMDACECLEKIAVIDPKDCKNKGNKVIAYKELMALGSKKHEADTQLFEKLADAVEPDDLLTIQYTSGSTGLPKGAMLTHGNIMAIIRGMDKMDPPVVSDTDTVVGFLPLSHVFERIPVHFYVMYKGLTKSYASEIATIAEDIKEKSPSIIFAVPRIHEKIYQKMHQAIAEKPKAVQKLFEWAKKVGTEISLCKQQNTTPSMMLKLKYKIAYKLVFKKLQDTLGGRLRWMCAAGGPIATEIVYFFNAAGIFVLEGWGMSELSGGVTLSNLNDFCPGSVGRPLLGVDIKIASDGEILVKGENVTKGYWKLEEKTKALFNEHGYLKTGDVGKFDDRGLLYITDRKKDLIITSGGKNIAPQKIEATFKNNPVFSQFIVIGDARKYLTALVTLEPETAKTLAEKQNIPFDRIEDLLENAAFRKVLDQIFEDTNKNLARVETIKKYKILHNDFSIDSGELTVSLKVKRNVVVKKYADKIDEMYA